MKSQMTGQMKVPGSWARQVCPGWLFTVYDAAERIHLSVGRTKVLIHEYGIPTGRLKRRVKIADGVIRTRFLTVLTPSALELLLDKHAGLDRNMNKHRAGRRTEHD